MLETDNPVIIEPGVYNITIKADTENGKAERKVCLTVTDDGTASSAVPSIELSAQPVEKVQQVFDLSNVNYENISVFVWEGFASMRLRLQRQISVSSIGQWSEPIISLCIDADLSLSLSFSDVIK